MPTRRPAFLSSQFLEQNVIRENYTTWPAYHIFCNLCFGERIVLLPGLGTRPEGQAAAARFCSACGGPSVVITPIADGGLSSMRSHWMTIAVTCGMPETRNSELLVKELFALWNANDGVSFPAFLKEQLKELDVVA